MNLNLIAKVLIICLGLLEAVSSTPTEYTASDGQKYLIELAKQNNWFKSWYECTRKDYQLLKIDSEEKNTAVTTLLKKVAKGRPLDVWIGGYDDSNSKNRNRTFIWSATGEPLNFTNWAGINPNNDKTGEHCIQIWSKSRNYGWNDGDCNKLMGFICEVNNFKKKSNNDLKHKCDVVKNTTSSIIDEVGQAHTQLSEIDSKNQQAERMGNDLRAHIEKLQINAQTAIQQILDAQKETVQRLIDEMLQKFSAEDQKVKDSKTDIIGKLETKLTVKQDKINIICH